MLIITRTFFVVLFLLISTTYISFVFGKDDIYTDVVNLKNKLSKDYKPKNLVSITKLGVDKCNPEDTVKVKKNLKFNVEIERLVQEGKQKGLDICITSGFRSYEEQKSLSGENKYIIKPGASEHQLGTTIDFASKNSKENWKVRKFIKQNSYKYGFILTYPKGNNYFANGKGKYEPWHYRYIGKYEAKIFNEIGNKKDPQQFLDNIDKYIKQFKLNRDIDYITECNDFGEHRLDEFLFYLKNETREKLIDHCYRESINYTKEQKNKIKNFMKTNNFNQNAQLN